jgi:hypothetical protein
LSQLTPSELVYLNGEQFAGPPGASRRVRLLHSGVEVRLGDLALTALASALLANLQAGTLKLAQREHSRWFGLSKKEILSIDPTGTPNTWPEQTLEAGLLNAASLGEVRKESGSLERGIFAWLGASFDDPFGELVARIQSGLAARGLLRVTEERKLLAVSRSYEVPPETLALARNVEPVKAMLEQFQTARPHQWPLLLETLRKAVLLRQAKREIDYIDAQNEH